MKKINSNTHCHLNKIRSISKIIISKVSRGFLSMSKSSKITFGLVLIGTILYSIKLVHSQKQSEIRIASSDSLRISHLADRAFKLYLSNFDSTIFLGHEVLKESKEINFNYGIARSYNAIGSGHYAKNNYDSAAYYFSLAQQVNFSIGNTKARASNLSNLGSLYNRIGNFETSLVLLDSAKELYESIGDSFLLETGSILTNIGAGYTALQEYDKAEKSLLEAIVLLKKSNNEIATAEPINNLANVQYANEDYYNAWSNYLKAEHIYESNSYPGLPANTSY